MFVAAGLVTSLIVWMWRTGRSVRRRLEHRLDTLVGQATTTTVENRAALGIFGLSFFMMLREGVEMVLPLAARADCGGASRSLRGGQPRASPAPQARTRPALSAPGGVGASGSDDAE